MPTSDVLTKFAEYPKEIEERRPGRVVAQIYPLTFYDSNGDGIGDIKGIARKLTYLSTFSDTLWISPLFPSPPGRLGDNGYAPTDRRDIARHFGSIDDLRDMVATAENKHGLKTLLDFVPCHTSHLHPDFIKSVARAPGYEDLYVWHPGRKDDQGNHIPPNNWRNVSNERAWTWNENRQEWYLQHFGPQQPALNLNRQEVQDRVIEDMKFLFRAVRPFGFRVDAVPFATHKSVAGLSPDEVDKQTNNPWMVPWPNEERWDQQWFENSICQGKTLGFLGRMRFELNKTARELGREGPFLMIETIAGRRGGLDSIAVAAQYKKPVDACHTEEALFFQYPGQARLKQVLTNLEENLQGKAFNIIGNHDFPRFESRINDVPDAAKRQLRKILFCMPGDIGFMAGAEELGLTQGQVPDDKKKDWLGRDGERTPGTWKAAAAHAGFTRASEPYLPVSEAHYQSAVDRQEGNPGSMLNYFRAMHQWRKKQPAILKGQMIVIDNPGDVLAFLRVSKDQTMLCLFNMSNKDNVTFRPSDYMDGKFLRKLGLQEGETITIDKPYGEYFAGGRSFGVHPEPVRHQAPKRPAIVPQHAAEQLVHA